MLIKRIRVQNVRCLQFTDLTLNAKLNVVCGENGAGKSSILEALSILSQGKSFRSRQIDKVINYEKDNLTVFATVDQGGLKYSIGVQRDRKGLFAVKVNGVPFKTLAELTRIVPIFTITPGFYDEFINNRKCRLGLFDWGLFHVEHSFHTVWKDYSKALKQRNSLLKQIQVGRSKEVELDYWDQVLSSTGEMLKSLRTAFCDRVIPEFNKLLETFGTIGDRVGFKARSGWKSGVRLSQVICENRDSDIKRGFTQYGAHRADWQLSMDGKLLADVASRGQQKVVVNCLFLAVIKLFLKMTDKSCLIAIDDLPSELDIENQSRLIQALQELDNTQVVVTAIGIDSLPKAISGYNRAMFHVEHGQFNVL